MKAETSVRIAGHEVAITRPGKILFPKDGITKGELIHYYERIAPLMLPYLEGRPLVLQRFPDGIDKPGFIQKAAGAYYPAWIKTARVKKAGGTVRHVVADDAATPVYLANQGCVTLHPWLSRVDDINCPDQMVFDFDPSRDDDLAGVVAAALMLKDVLDRLELPAYVKATGSRGVHVVVPLDGLQDFDAMRAFARQLAGVVVDRDTGRYTLEQRKDKRHGRVLIDVNRNAYAQTAVATYSVRARPGAPVSVPLEWSELRKKSFRPDAFTLRNVFDRLEKTEDPWKDFRRDAASLKAAAPKLEKLHAA
ncbi:MAG TPA: non-homologous end-joining DNA ligase [Bryobacteraceae bacterium]|nr:non-homologous end-joining DNA ligase [Bryobacteraceae bacterium]